MKRAIKIASGTFLAVILFSVTFVAFPATVVEGASYNVSSSASDNLKMYIGKEVVIHMHSGKTFQGHVKSVGDNFIHLEKLSGRDFYDALIRIEDISAIEAKFRDMK